MRAALLTLPLALTLALPLAARAQDAAIETAALRCSAVSLLHSSLTVPSPQFGEFMGQIAGLFAEIYRAQLRVHSKPSLAPAELKSRRDALLIELRKAWPGNKDKLVREAAICNAWRAEFFARLPEKPSEKEFTAALEKIAPPPANLPKAEIDKWVKLTPEAMGAAAAMQAQVPKK